MRIKKGTKVKFLNDHGGGTISGVVDENTVVVTIEDGFDIPVKVSEIIVDNSTQYDNEDNTIAEETVERKKNKPTKISFDVSDDIDLTKDTNTQINIALAIVPNNPNNIAISNFKGYLINDSNYGVFYSTGYLNNNVAIELGKGYLENETKVLIGDFSQSELTQQKQYYIQCIFTGNSKHKFQEPLSQVINLNDYNFYRNKDFAVNDYFDEPALIINFDNFNFKEAIEKLSKHDFNTQVKHKDSVDRDEKLSNFLKPKKAPKSFQEIDLHIHEIIDNYKDLSNGEIINLQLNRFEIALEGAIKNNEPKIVFIHGVGEGKLKYELRKKLDTQYPDLAYQDASFKEYGYGATLVLLKK